MASNFLESKHPKQVLILAADILGLPASKYKKNPYKRKSGIIFHTDKETY